jgi:hypothetical protein
MLSKILSALGVAPKTLPQATETLGEAKATLDSVAALFTAAGLNLEQILAAGPESLKAHIDSFDTSEELTEALAENEKLTADLSVASNTLALRDSTLTAFSEFFGAIGMADITNKTQASEVKSKWEAHVSKQTTLALAKTGHPPAHVPASDVTGTAAPTAKELHAQWKAMKPSAERLAFFSKHEAAITAHERNAA